MTWGIEQAKVKHTPLYLESTTEAKAFYRRLGFVAGELLSLQYVNSEDNQQETYTETIFIFTAPSGGTEVPRSSA